MSELAMILMALNVVAAIALAWRAVTAALAEREHAARAERDAAVARANNADRARDTAQRQAVDALVAPATFTPIYRDWLRVREQKLAAKLESLKIEKEKNVLLINATKGTQLFPSIADFFSQMQRSNKNVRVTSASYFDDVYELAQGVSRKGLTVIPISEVAAWTRTEINRFDLVMAVGPSDVFLELMLMPGIEAKLVYLDLGFYHQLIESGEGAFLRGQFISDRRTAQKNRITCYSCQPEAKVRKDLDKVFALELFDWRWFNYIPIGFTYGTYYWTDKHAFDIGLFGSDSRVYSEIDPALFQGRRFLFVGAADRTPDIEKLRGQIDLTIVSRVDQDTYARLLALCRCVVLPFDPRADNVLLSVTDALAAGKALVTQRRSGVARLEKEEAPIIFYEGTADLQTKVESLLREDGKLKSISERSVAFAKDKLDMYGILETIVREQLV